MPLGRGLSLFLIDGVPSGRIACEIFNWTGKGYKLPRARIRESADRVELYKAGVYLLFGREEMDPETPVVYVGEAEEVYRRLQQHQSRDFWNDVVLFVSKDDNLNKAHIKFLEYRLVDAIRGAGRARLVNANTPNLPVISELEQAVMEEFLGNVKLVVSTLGYRIFEPLARPLGEAAASGVDAEGEGVAAVEYLARSKRGGDARAVMTDEGLVVRRGSRVASKVTTSMPQWALDLRERLLEAGVLVDVDGGIEFVRDYLASSPSSAATIVLGRSANGRTEWRTKSGQSLGEREEASENVAAASLGTSKGSPATSHDGPDGGVQPISSAPGPGFGSFAEDDPELHFGIAVDADDRGRD